MAEHVHGATRKAIDLQHDDGGDTPGAHSLHQLDERRPIRGLRQHARVLEDLNGAALVEPHGVGVGSAAVKLRRQAEAAQSLLVGRDADVHRDALG